MDRPVHPYEPAIHRQESHMAKSAITREQVRLAMERAGTTVPSYGAIADHLNDILNERWAPLGEGSGIRGAVYRKDDEAGRISLTVSINTSILPHGTDLPYRSRAARDLVQFLNEHNYEPPAR